MALFMLIIPFSKILAKSIIQEILAADFLCIKHEKPKQKTACHPSEGKLILMSFIASQTKWTNSYSEYL